MPNNYILLETIALTQSAASVTFDNLPTSGYTDLKVVMSARGTASLSSGYVDGIITFNGSTSGYSERMVYGIGSTASSANQSSTGIKWNFATSSVTTASTFGNSEAYIPNYRSSTNKSVSVDTVAENNSSTVNILALNAGLWSNTAAITSITITAGSGSFDVNSTFSLYGIAAFGTTPVLAPKAFGGNSIENDGTYWIHTFTSSGIFTPQTSLACEYLVIAGGGSGGASYGGGGGAGGYRTGTLSVLPSNLPITVGAGGASSTDRGNNGSDSIFSSITSTGGGGGGTGNPQQLSVGPGNGGSGGGVGGWVPSTNSTNTPIGTGAVGQGNNGGTSSGTGWKGGGGGGGAGAVGNNGSNNGSIALAGNGGAGLSSSISGTAVTRGGGGGGGAGFNGTEGTAGTGGAGGGGNGSNTTTGSAGTANTGGGGGGGDQNDSSGAGGSGIVIIRYPIA
jgi:hypothetical protein